METKVKKSSCETTFRNNAKWDVHGPGATAAGKQRGTEKNKTAVSVLCLPWMWHRGPGCHGEQRGAGTFHSLSGLIARPLGRLRLLLLALLLLLLLLLLALHLLHVPLLGGRLKLT